MVAKAAIGAAVALPMVFVMGITGIATVAGNVTAAVSSANGDETSAILPSCQNLDVGLGVEVQGLTPIQAQNATILTQEALRRGLGREAAEIAIMAGMTETGLDPGDRGDNKAEPEYMWSQGLFQTKLWYHMQDAWKKPGGGMYPKNDRASIDRAKAMAYDVNWQANWFYNRMETVHVLKNFKWRDSSQFKDKPWMVAQTVENSRFKDGSNYKAAWEGNKIPGLTPAMIVDSILAAGGESATSTYTTINSRFDLKVDEATGMYIIPNPTNAPLGKSGYPIIRKKESPQLSIAKADEYEVEVAKWAQPVFEDLIGRWRDNPTINGGRLSLGNRFTEVRGWNPVSRNADGWTDYASGTAIKIVPGSVNFKKNPLTDEEAAAIEVIVADMGGIVVWGGRDNPGYFYIPSNIAPEKIENWKTTYNSTGTPPYFMVGDSIGNSVDETLAKALPDFSYKTEDGRRIEKGISILRTDPEAKKAKTWIVQLGTNNGNDAAAMKGFIDTVMGLAGNRKVYWINAYRPTTNGMGPASVNNGVLLEAAQRYSNLTIMDWNSRAVANLSWFETDDMKLHPQGEGKTAFVDMVKEYLTGNGNNNIGQSILCGNGTGTVTDPDFVGTMPAGAQKVTTNYDIQLAKADVAVKRALSFVGNPPCGDGQCNGLCGRLSAMVWGQPRSGYYTAKTQWEASVKKGLAEPAMVGGEKNPEAWNIPVGALLYWDTKPRASDGLDHDHVATYVGDGWVVSNWNGSKGYGVYKLPFSAFDGYGPYHGWAMPPW